MLNIVYILPRLYACCGLLLRYMSPILDVKYYYLLKMIQKFWLVESGGWNRHIRSVVAQIWIYDIIIEYWKHICDIMT